MSTDTTGAGTAPRLDRDLAVSAARALPVTVDTELLSTLRALPVMLHQHGLSAACAYLLSRTRSAAAGADAGSGQDRYTRAVTALLHDAARFVGIDPGGRTPLAVLDGLLGTETDYRIAERRARAFSVWLAHLAAARHAQQPPPSTRTHDNTDTNTDTATDTGAGTGSDTAAGPEAGAGAAGTAGGL